MPVITENTCKLLIHSDTTAGSTVITDSSPNANTVTFNGTGRHYGDFGQIPSGSTCIDCANNNSNSFGAEMFEDFGTEDFVIDFWHRSGLGWDSCPLTQRVDGVERTFDFYFSSTGTAYIRMWTSADAERLISFNYTSFMSINTWHHIALFRNGNTLYCQIDGVTRGTLDVTGDTFAASTVVYVNNGRSSPVANCNGYVDEVRISIGEYQDFSLTGVPTDQYIFPYDTIAALGVEAYMSMQAGSWPNNLLGVDAVMSMTGTYTGLSYTATMNMRGAKGIMALGSGGAFSAEGAEAVMSMGAFVSGSGQFSGVSRPALMRMDGTGNDVGAISAHGVRASMSMGGAAGGSGTMNLVGSPGRIYAKGYDAYNAMNFLGTRAMMRFNGNGIAEEVLTYSRTRYE